MKARFIAIVCLGKAQKSLFPTYDFFQTSPT